MKLGKVDASKLFALTAALAGAALALTFVRLNLAQSGSEATAAIVGLPEDWTHRHVVFTESEDPAVVDAMRRDPRYWLQQLKRNGTAAVQSLADLGLLPSPASPSFPHGLLPHRGRHSTAVDWSVSMGNAGAKVSDGMYPAKFTFNVNASPDCLNDFIVFGEDIASLAAVAASGTGTFSGTGQGTNAQTVTVNGTAFTATGAYASDIGTFTSPPASNTALTLTNNSPANVLTLTTNATTASAIGTFATTPPAFNTSITITNSAVSPSNTL